MTTAVAAVTAVATATSAAATPPWPSRGVLSVLAERRTRLVLVRLQFPSLPLSVATGARGGSHGVARRVRPPPLTSLPPRTVPAVDEFDSEEDPLEAWTEFAAFLATAYEAYVAAPLAFAAAYAGAIDDALCASEQGYY
ncbi:hypothetical protein MMPV_002822 [Pyropia vietnamensis]